MLYTWSKMFAILCYSSLLCTPLKLLFILSVWPWKVSWKCSIPWPSSSNAGILEVPVVTWRGFKAQGSIYKASGIICILNCIGRAYLNLNIYHWSSACFTWPRIWLWNSQVHPTFNQLHHQASLFFRSFSSATQGEKREIVVAVFWISVFDCEIWWNS